jgi:uncharacterized protein
MDAKQIEIIEKSEAFVREKLSGAEAGHDLWHIMRVRNLAKQIRLHEGGDLLVVELGALFHDIADAKFNGGDEEEGPAIARKFFSEIGLSQDIADHVCRIIEHISFRKGISPFRSPEFDIVQDADRLDAMGAIGIARAFQYGGFKNRLMYSPMDNERTHTINHFHEKLLLLKERMNTPTGKKLAEERHVFMEKYLEQFLKEWNSGDGSFSD